MAPIRLAGLVLGVVLGLLGARPAEACGSWSMADTERGLAIRYLINSASITKGTQRKAALYFEERPEGLRHDLPSWRLTVRRGDDVIVEGTGVTALCASIHRVPAPTEAAQHAEIRQRVIYYLAWRERGA